MSRQSATPDSTPKPDKSGPVLDLSDYPTNQEFETFESVYRNVSVLADAASYVDFVSR